MIALLLAAMSAQAAAPAPAADLCVPPAYRVIGPSTGRGPRKLTELPPAQTMLAVEKHVGGCAVNVLKQKDLTGNHVMVPAGPARPVRAPTKGRRR